MEYIVYPKYPYYIQNDLYTFTMPQLIDLGDPSKPIDLDRSLIEKGIATIDNIIKNIPLIMIGKISHTNNKVHFDGGYVDFGISDISIRYKCCNLIIRLNEVALVLIVFNKSINVFYLSDKAVISGKVVNVDEFIDTIKVYIDNELSALFDPFGNL